LMRYSLLSRFQGALVGSLLGEFLGNIGYQERVVGEAWLASLKPEDSCTTQTLSDWSQLATCGTESLIRCGKLDLDDWWELFGKAQSSVLCKGAVSSNEVAVMTLPIALFFHDDELKLRQQLLQVGNVWHNQPEVLEGVLAVAYAIALALTEKLDCTTLIPQVLSYLNPSQTLLVQQLEQVQTLLERGAGLETTLSHLRRDTQHRGKLLERSHTSIALAFYCFLTTPEDFRLCVSRAARTRCQPQITSALTGALAGVYNSLIGIPVSWRLSANHLSSSIHRLRLADCLLEVWAGVYDVSASAKMRRLTVAAPRVIQPR
jgi:ADP-ribosylglycohydrolase